MRADVDAPPPPHPTPLCLQDLFEPFLHQLGYRLAHVQRRMLPIAMHLLQKDGQFLNGHDLFLKVSG
mgnify:CR=1 FL=1